MGFEVSYLAGGRLDPPYMPTKTKPFIKGIHAEVLKSAADKTVDYLLDYEGELLSVAVGVDKDYPEDNWSITLLRSTGEIEPICENIYTKLVPEGMYLMAIITVNVDDILRFTFENADLEHKWVWVNYQFLR